MSLAATHTPSIYPIGDPRHPNAVPRLEASDEMAIIGGAEWCRNFPRVCPFCGQRIYTWAPWPWPEDWKPNVPDSTLDLDGGHRETCGMTECVDSAQQEHAKHREDKLAAYYERQRTQESLARAAEENERKMREMERSRQ